ncbi:MAG: hypothetical protein Q7S92_03670 [Candidatus Diapherotrites archaeon]|nr:hypothetical protein [Candidatus Diapherotrites archaeon]
MAKLNQIQVQKPKENKIGTGFALLIGITVVVLGILSLGYIFQPTGASNGVEKIGNVIPENPAELKGLDKFAYCLAQNDLVMYGAYWCEYCQAQRALFGNSFQYAKYVECGVQGDRKAQTQVCKDAQIQSYPTWKKGLQKVTSVQEFSDLAELSGCILENSVDLNQ